MKILYFLRITDSGEIKRSDFRDIIRSLNQRGDEIHIYDTATAKHYKAEDNGQLVKLSGGRSVSGMGVITLFLRLFKLFVFCIKNNKEYDVAHFCYIREEFLLLWFVVFRPARLNIATVYGADVGQRNLIKKHFSRFFYLLDIITITGTNGSDLLKMHFKYDRLKKKIIMLPLPSSILRSISAKKLEKTEAKELLGFSPNDVILVCGSVLSPNEQYENWVPLLAETLRTDSRIKAIFPFSYGNTDLLPYYRSIIEKSLPAGSCRIMTGWASDEDTATLRTATDILISLRKNDQFAGIILESIFTGAIVITGTWLKYSYLEEKKIWHLRITGFNELAGRLSEAVNILDEKDGIERLESNRKLISGDFGYEEVFRGWLDFYNGIRTRMYGSEQ